MFLGKPMEKRSSRVGTMLSKQLDVKNQLCLDVYCSVQPRPLAIDFDSGFVNRNPLRLRLRRVVTAVSQRMYPLLNRLVGAFNAEQSKNFFCPLSEQPVAWSWTANVLTGVAVRSRSQVSSKSTVKHSLSRSASIVPTYSTACSLLKVT